MTTVGLVLDVLYEYMQLPKSAVPMFEEACQPEVSYSRLTVGVVSCRVSYKRTSIASVKELPTCT